MPYFIEKVRNGYYVSNLDTRNRYSKKPHKNIEKALKQLQVIQTNSNENKGGGSGGTLVPYHGGGLFNPIKFLKQRFSGFTGGKRLDYSPSVRKELAFDNYLPIAGLCVMRKPVASIIQMIMNGLSQGEFADLVKSKGYDNVFHLYMRIDLAQPHRRDSYLIEKNQVISFREFKLKDDTADRMDVDLNGREIILETFLNNTKSGMGEENYFYYNPVNNNCQVFIKSLLQYNNLLTPELEKFIYQDLQEMENTMPFTSKFANAITDFAGRADILLSGRGILI